jgi:ribonuclease BN (tRNA processing enzyme)
VIIRVLGCYGSDRLVTEDGTFTQCGTCGFLLNDTVMIDAGTIGAQLDLEAQSKIRHVVLSHLHFDHIKGLPTLADNLADTENPPVAVTGTKEVLAGLRRHIFNDDVYPDFFQLLNKTHPVLTERVMSLNEEVVCDGLSITPIKVNHTVPTTGFIIADRESAVLYSGDTYQTNDLWRTARQTPNLQAAFIEASFPNRLANVARMSKHLTPTMLQAEFAKLGKPDLPLYVYHMKPRYQDEIRRELDMLNIEHLHVLEEGEILNFNASGITQTQMKSRLSYLGRA